VPCAVLLSYLFSAVILAAISLIAGLAR
jgi:hypothetical protein